MARSARNRAVGREASVEEEQLPNSIFFDKSLPSTGETGGLHGSRVSAQLRLDSTPGSCDVNVIVTSSGKQVVKIRRFMILANGNPARHGELCLLLIDSSTYEAR